MKRIYVGETGRDRALIEQLCAVLGRIEPERREREIDAWSYSLIYEGRNRLYRMWGDEGDFVVKYFGQQAMWRRAYYGWIGESKAKRSYFNARRLLGLNLETPKPLGYMEQYDDLSMLTGGCYVCDFHNFLASSIHPHMGGKTAPQGFLSALSVFLYRLHEAGVEHLDLSPGNIPYERDEEGAYIFYLVDLNRIKFRDRSLSLSRRLTNMQRLSYNLSVSTQLAHYYGMIAQAEGFPMLDGARGREDLICRYNKLCNQFWQRRLWKLAPRYNYRHYGAPKIYTLLLLALFYAYAGAYLLNDRRKGNALHRRMERLYLRYIAAEDIRHVLRRRYGLSYRFRM